MASRSEDIFLDSSMVEHSAVNRVVVGSSPTRGVYFNNLFVIIYIVFEYNKVWRSSQAVRRGTATP